MADRNLSVKQLQRSDTTNNWNAKNPILREGEIGYDNTKKRIKIGDGHTVWSDLLYVDKIYDRATTVSDGLLSFDDKTKIDGLKNADVKSVFGRIGDILAQESDYIGSYPVMVDSEPVSITPPSIVDNMRKSEYDKNNDGFIDGAVYVSSVLGINGSLNIDADTLGGKHASEFATAAQGVMANLSVGIGLLWTNPSPTSAFLAQTVNVNLTDYDIIGVVFYRSSTENILSQMFIFNKTTTLFSQAGMFNGTANLTRNITQVTNAGVTFGQAVSGTTPNDTFMIPYQIYGIKGVQNV